MKAYDSKRVCFFFPQQAATIGSLRWSGDQFVKGIRPSATRQPYLVTAGNLTSLAFYTHTHTKNQRQTNCEVDIFTPCELRLTVRPGSDGGGEGDPQLKWV